MTISILAPPTIVHDIKKDTYRFVATPPTPPDSVCASPLLASRSDSSFGNNAIIAPFSLPHIFDGSCYQAIRNVLGGVDLDECDAHGENAFLVCDLKRVWDMWQRWQLEFGGTVEPFFAVKCNPDPLILLMLARLGAGFDCASHTEISTILEYGVSPEQIIYANPCKAASFIRHAAKNNVEMMTFDNADELTKVAKYHKNAKMVLRILTDDSGSLCAFGIKFGAPLTAVRGLLEKAKDLAIDVIGISFHVGSGCSNPFLYHDAIKNARWAFDVAKEIGFDFNFLDIGGGFESVTFSAIAAVVRDAVKLYFPPEMNTRVIAEPGRYFVSDAFEMATNIIARRAREVQPAVVKPEDAEVGAVSELDQAAAMYYINDGVYGAFNCIMFDHQVVHPQLLTLNGSFDFPTPSQAELKPCSVWGPTCDSIDLVSKQSFLPSDLLQVGDWLRWENMGAYTICAASQFNGFRRSKVFYTIEADSDIQSTIRNLLEV